MITKCESVFRDDSTDVSKSDAFLTCDKDVLSHILNKEELSCSETVVFEACISWVKNASEQSELTMDIIREHLGTLFHQLRFRSRTVDEFVPMLESYGHLFSTEEYKDVLQLLKKNKYKPTIFTEKSWKMKVKEWIALVWWNEKYTVVNSFVSIFRINMYENVGKRVYS